MMNTKMMIVVLGLCVAACSSSEREPIKGSEPVDPEDNTAEVSELNQCVTPGAAYRTKYTERSGNCGPIPESTDTDIWHPHGLFGGGRQEDGTYLVPEGCKLGPRARYEGCSVYTELSCNLKNEDGAYTFTIVGKMVWADDGSSGSGVVAIKINFTDDSCYSTYNVSARRLSMLERT